MSTRNWRSLLRLSRPIPLRAALACIAIATLTLAAGLYRSASADSAAHGVSHAASETTTAAAPAIGEPTLELSGSQLQLLDRKSVV